MRSWRFEFENLTPEELSAMEERIAKCGPPKPWYDCLPPDMGFEPEKPDMDRRFLPGAKVRVVEAYLPYDEAVVGKIGTVIRWLGVGMEGAAVEVRFDEDVPQHLRLLAFPVRCLEKVTDQRGAIP